MANSLDCSRKRQNQKSQKKTPLQLITMKYIVLLVAAIAAIGSTAAAPTAMIPDALAGGAEVQCCMCEHPFRPRCSKSCCADSN
ncbi:hypothetical protein BG000_004812 [Podila horticola]|nr:hypothetical protein BG000_004812 [Podila horticola]